VVGLGAMLGAGVFAVLGPAAEVAGSGLLIALAITAAVAFCNAMSSAWLAARHPESGGAYVYGRRQLGANWGRLAGWAFVAGKTASCAAMALTFGAYVAPDAMRPLALGAVVALTAVNLRGIKRTAGVTRVLVAIVLACLAAIAVAGFADADPDRLGPVRGGGILEAAGLLFFAFAGYARLATLGEEVVAPERTLPRAIPLALGIALAVYATVALSALLAVGPAGLAAAEAPLAEVAEAPARIGAAIACLGVLLSMIAGVSRTALAMAREHDLPHVLAHVHPVHRVPDHAELAVAAIVCLVVLAADVRDAIAFSAVTVLVYYAVTNAAAWTLGRRVVPAAGLAGCLVLAVSVLIG
jgi:APA family basic amino acid/polyamine antiporter